MRRGIKILLLVIGIQFFVPGVSYSNTQIGFWSLYSGDIQCEKMYTNTCIIGENNLNADFKLAPIKSVLDQDFCNMETGFCPEILVIKIISDNKILIVSGSVSYAPVSYASLSGMIIYVQMKYNRSTGYTITGSRHTFIEPNLRAEAKSFNIGIWEEFLEGK